MSPKISTGILILERMLFTDFNRNQVLAGVTFITTDKHKGIKVDESHGLVYSLGRQQVFIAERHQGLNCPEDEWQRYLQMHGLQESPDRLHRVEEFARLGAEGYCQNRLFAELNRERDDYSGCLEKCDGYTGNCPGNRCVSDFPVLETVKRYEEIESQKLAEKRLIEVE